VSDALASVPTVVGLTAVIIAVTDEIPRVLVARRIRHDLATPAQRGQDLHALDSPDTLPFGPFDPAADRTLALGLRRWVKEQTGLDLRYVEQLYSFGDRFRDPRELDGGPRVLSIAYLALTGESPVAGSGDARWQDVYGFLPWEDWRAGRPAVLDRAIRPGLDRWLRGAPTALERQLREERVRICFGLEDSALHDGVRTLERYELLYEAGLVAESVRDRAFRTDAGFDDPTGLSDSRATVDAGAAMALDNRRILATALGRLRGKLAYRPVVFELLPEAFTLFQLQRVVEALTGTRLHKQNFRRMVLHGAVVEPIGRTEATGRGRPAEVYRFRRDVLKARAAVGVGLPAVRTADENRP
jgi:hypothetical protein